MTEQDLTPPQPASQQAAPQENTSAEATPVEGQESAAPAEPTEPVEEIDLNQVFPDEETDLNELFPEEEMRTLLKKVNRNTKDLGKMKDRFSDTFQETD